MATEESTFLVKGVFFDTEEYTFLVKGVSFDTEESTFLVKGVFVDTEESTFLVKGFFFYVFVPGVFLCSAPKRMRACTHLPRSQHV